jgi:hypothetical protein
MTTYKVNDYDFSEVTSSDKHVLVTNNLGRTAEYAELVYLDGYFGEVVDTAGIANGATGYININADRTVRTKQVEATDTFTAGNTLWFVSGGSGAAGTLEDADPGSGTRYACGIITDEEGTGGAQTAVEFRPFVQRLDATDVSAQVSTNTTNIATNASDISDNDDDIGTLASLTTSVQTDLVSAINEVDANADANASSITTLQAEPRIAVQKVTTGAADVTLTALSEGDEIIGVEIIPTGNSTNGTIQIQDSSANAITDAMTCAVDTTIARAATIDDAYSTLPSGTNLIVCAGDTVANTVAIVIFTYIPA